MAAQQARDQAQGHQARLLQWIARKRARSRLKTFGISSWRGSWTSTATSGARRFPSATSCSSEYGKFSLASFPLNHLLPSAYQQSSPASEPNCLKSRSARWKTSPLPSARMQSHFSPSSSSPTRTASCTAASSTRANGMRDMTRSRWGQPQPWPQPQIKVGTADL